MRAVKLTLFDFNVDYLGTDLDREVNNPIEGGL